MIITRSLDGLMLRYLFNFSTVISEIDAPMMIPLGVILDMFLAGVATNSSLNLTGVLVRVGVMLIIAIS